MLSRVIQSNEFLVRSGYTFEAVVQDFIRISQTSSSADSLIVYWRSATMKYTRTEQINRKASEKRFSCRVLFLTQFSSAPNVFYITM